MNDRDEVFYLRVELLGSHNIGAGLFQTRSVGSTMIELDYCAEDWRKQSVREALEALKLALESSGMIGEKEQTWTPSQI